MCLTAETTMKRRFYVLLIETASCLLQNPAAMPRLREKKALNKRRIRISILICPRINILLPRLLSLLEYVAYIVWSIF